MIGRTVGTIARRSIARSLGLGAAAAPGSPLLPAILGAALPTALRRASPVALLAFAAGGLVARRLLARRRQRRSESPRAESPPAG